MNANPSVAGLEAIIERFESAWSSGQRPGIDDYLAGQCGDPQSLLMELVLTELEFRLKSGEAARVEEYLGRYPQLGDQRAATALLIRFEYLIRNAREPELDPAEFVWRFPDQYQCLFEGHDIHRDGMDVRDILARHPRSRQLQDQVGWPDNRFELDQMHAQGGLGTVWKARDKMFDRLVAIKEVKSQCALNERYQQRLRREARITARLEHPGIVPVYALGQFEDGHFYYAMRYIEGNSFRQAILEYHQRTAAGASSGDCNIGLRKLLANFVDICNTMYYAHSQNVIHRDLKPQNIMIGEFGETMVVDWGLAKELGEPESSDTPFHSDPAADGTPETNLATGQGDVFGSPGYMSPEQAGGEIQRLDQLSDVYSLGATLFTLLTDQDPCEVKNAKRLLKQNPRPLAAICSKAMSGEPDGRYANAKLLADDVERFLADEPTTAHPESWLEKTARTARRHQRLIRVAAVALAALATVTMIAAVWINNERQIATRAAARTDLEKRRIEDAFMLFTQMFRSPDQQYVATGMTAYELLSRAVAEFEKHDDPVMRGRLLNAASHAFAALGDREQARQCAEKSWAILSRQPDADQRIRLKTLNRLADACADLGYYYQALRLVQESLAIAEQNPAGRDDTWLEALSLRSSIYRNLQMPRQALADARTALEISVAMNGTLDRHTLHLQDMLGIALYADGQIDKARKAFEDIIAIRSQNPQLNPTDMFVACRNLALWHEDRQDYASATEIRKQVMDGLSAELGTLHPETLSATRKYHRARFFNGDTDGAITDLHLLRAALEKEFSTDNLEVLRTVKLLSWLYRNKEAFDRKTASREGTGTPSQLTFSVADSISVLDEAIQLCAQGKPGADNLITLELMDQLAWAHLSNDDIDKAIEVRRHQVEIWDQRLQAQTEIHGNYLKSLEHLAELLAKKGDRSEARRVSTKLAEIRSQQVGPH